MFSTLTECCYCFSVGSFSKATSNALFQVACILCGQISLKTIYSTEYSLYVKDNFIYFTLFLLNLGFGLVIQKVLIKVPSLYLFFEQHIVYNMTRHVFNVI